MANKKNKKKIYPAFVGSLDQQSESRDREVPERAMPYLKAITKAGFLVSLGVINATLKLLWRLNLCDGAHIGCATKVILYRITL